VTDAFFRGLAKAAALRYDARDRFARNFAYGKLTRDPVFRYLLVRGLLPREARILDLGCGQGLLAALLAQARMQENWPGTWAPAPNPAAYHGIDLEQRDVERATLAGGDGASFTCGDIRSADFGKADAVVLLDVLHYIDYAAQEDTLRRSRAALGGGGVLLLRVADELDSWHFRWTLWIDRLAMALRGRRLASYHCRPLEQWKEMLEALGFAVEAVPMSAGTPFANVLLVGRYHS
jgi:SAM-dependent methyltransferase